MTTLNALCTTFLDCKEKADSIMRLRHKWKGELRHHKVTMLKRERELIRASNVLEQFVVVYSACIESMPSLSWHHDSGAMSNLEYTQKIDLLLQARKAALTYAATTTECAEQFIFHQNRVSQLTRMLTLDGFSERRAERLYRRGRTSIKRFVQQVLSRK